MNTKTFTISVLLTLFATVINAQNFDVPENYVLNVAADYANYEKDIIASANWMENTPLNVDKQKELKPIPFL